jgi:cytoskeletal protein RodZ
MKAYAVVSVLVLACLIPTAAASAQPVEAVSTPASVSAITSVPNPAQVQAQTVTIASKPAATLTADAITSAAKPSTSSTTTSAKTTGAKTKPKTATVAAPRTAVAKVATSMAVVVNVAGNQSAIDACKGAVLYSGAIIAQHDYCGGTRFYALRVGSLVALSGAAVRAGTYRVSAIANSQVGSSAYTWPSQYMIETCLSSGAVRLWYIERV